ncbi:glutaredoxin 3 [Kangiella sediminilitoris]|uniref:Glutaredoxin n=1 Tax=Kangiella sediminilitoris TaxID=1144748 RepID=A0A1B3B8B9_9GAMM|nr:glutaredoxin 3 [Kangiella sediminilitoris]AOE49043.1 glutaredoxin [Kangiella sediminilitoris]
MAKVEMYTKGYCPFCVRAKHLLEKLDVEYKEIPIDGDSELRQHMIELTGGHTVPQILINDEAIGGCDDLHALHAAGKLQTMLEK